MTIPRAFSPFSDPTTSPNGTTRVIAWEQRGDEPPKAGGAARARLMFRIDQGGVTAAGPWFERDDACISSGVCGGSGASMAENHYYVRFYDDTAGRMCEVNTEEDFGQRDSTQKPVHPTPHTEGISGSSVLIGGSPRRMVSVSMTNGLSSY